MRKFTAVGGSVVALAHTNKNRNTLGKVVQGGTSDIPQDADCTYTIDAEDQGVERIVKFENTKARGPVPSVVKYAYTHHKFALSARLHTTTRGMRPAL